MLLAKERQEVVTYCQKMLHSKLTSSTGGNISIYNSDIGLVAISPSGMAYDELTPEDIVVIGLEGNVVEGLRTPSSEWRMHLKNYTDRQDIFAIVHTHSTYSSTLATLGWELPAANYYIAIAGGENVRCAKYGSYGEADLAENAFRAMTDRFACFLANHGLLAAGVDIASAYLVAVEIERCAEVYWRASVLGKPLLLPTEEVDFMVRKFRNYGQA